MVEGALHCIESKNEVLLFLAMLILRDWVPLLQGRVEILNHVTCLLVRSFLSNFYARFDFSLDSCIYFCFAFRLPCLLLLLSSPFDLALHPSVLYLRF